jgi:hypothetical protein
LGASAGRTTGGRELLKGPTGMGHTTGAVQIDWVCLRTVITYII